MDEYGVIVVLAIDPGVMMEAVKAEYENRGRDYLNKIIQLPIHLNNPPSSELRRFASGLLPVEEAEDVTLPQNQRSRGEKVTESASEPSPSDARGDESEEGAGQVAGGQAGGGEPDLGELISEMELRAELTEITIEEVAGVMKYSRNEAEAFGELAVERNVSNPRQLIRLRNTFGLLKLLWYESLSPADRQHVFEPMLALKGLFLIDGIFELKDQSFAKTVIESIEENDALKGGNQEWVTLQNAVNKVADEHTIDLAGMLKQPAVRSMLLIAISLMLPHPKIDDLPDRTQNDDEAKDDTQGSAKGDED